MSVVAVALVPAAFLNLFLANAAHPKTPKTKKGVGGGPHRR